MPRFPINEIFLSIQGEGYFTGKPALFIRLQGCDVGCRYCDTKYARKIDDENQVDDVEDVLVKNGPSEKFVWMEQDELVKYVKVVMPMESTGSLNHVVITGGEPFFHQVNGFVDRLTNDGYYVQIETSGCYEIPEKCYAWVTLSPKKGCLESSYRRCDEIKFVVTDDTDFDEIARIQHPRKFLQPESCRVDMVQAAVAKAIEFNCRVSLQIHKYLEIR